MDHSGASGCAQVVKGDGQTVVMHVDHSAGVYAGNHSGTLLRGGAGGPVRSPQSIPLDPV